MLQKKYTNILHKQQILEFSSSKEIFESHDLYKGKLFPHKTLQTSAYIFTQSKKIRQTGII